MAKRLFIIGKETDTNRSLMHIFFLNVGQGDSIILKSENNSKTVWSIIDCNKVGDNNPVLNFVKDNKIEEIQYVILSHPHTDHFSGLLELIDYCHQNKIIINYFVHTCSPFARYIKIAFYSLEAEDKFWKLISRISELHESGYLKDCGVSEPFSTLPLGNGAELGTLAPGRDEHKKLAKPKKLPEEVEGNYSTANWLSTLFKITFSSSGNYSLLTSDCNKDSFNRVRKNVHNSEVLQLVQIPHHGSGHSFSKSFFKDRRKAANTVAVISSGNKYGHPHKEVIDTLTESGYNIV